MRLRIIFSPKDNSVIFWDVNQYFPSFEPKISARTAFWRHKILFAISQILKTDVVDGVVEADET